MSAKHHEKKMEEQVVLDMRTGMIFELLWSIELSAVRLK